MASLLCAAQASALGDVFQRVMRTLASMRDASKCFFAAEIDEVDLGNVESSVECIRHSGVRERLSKRRSTTRARGH